MIQAIFAVPGDIDTPTGGYGYARRLLAEAAGAGLQLRHVALPGGFPSPSRASLAETERLLRAAPTGSPILIDGLALGTLSAAMLRSLARPVIALCHHPLAMEAGLTPVDARGLKASERAALATCAHVITTSATTAEMLATSYAVPPARISVACPGTDPVPRATGSGCEATAILSVGSLTPRKGHDILIAALAGLADLDWILTIAGPTDRDPDHANALRHQISENHSGGRVRLIGELDAAALDKAYRRADLFVLASRFEGFGMAYTEAMAHGLAVLGCDAGAVAEATLGAAQLTPPDDIEAMRAALRGLISDTSARAGLAQACWQAAQRLPRWPDTAKVVADVVRRVTW